MENKKNKFLVISNHNPELWSKEQKEIIADDICLVYHEFPKIPPEFDNFDCYIIADELMDIIRKEKPLYISIQGEQSIIMGLTRKILENREIEGFDFVFWNTLQWIIPTTKRISKEVTNIDGTTRKECEFRFVRWRLVL